MQRKKKWRKRIHPFVRNAVFLFSYPFLRRLCGGKPQRFPEKGNRPYLILFNHQTVWDQFLINASFRQPVYFVGTEDLFSMGFVSSLLRYFISPIPFMKRTSDISSLRICLKVAREGNSIAIAPEGSMTFSGKTETMNPAIALFARTLGLPIALYRIDGGFGAFPRWSNSVRKGSNGAVRAGVARVLEKEDYAGWTNEELFAEIRKTLTVNEARDDGRRYASGHRAEYLERTAYWCPWCGFSTFRSKGNFIACLRCGRSAEYGEDKRLRGINCDFPFTYYADWYDAQEGFIRTINPDDYRQTPLYQDSGNLFEVIPEHKKNLLWKDAGIDLYGDRIVIRKKKESAAVFTFNTITSATTQLRNKLNFCREDGRIFQIKGGKRFNPVKYIHLFYRYQYIHGSKQNEFYLGL